MPIQRWSQIFSVLFLILMTGVVAPFLGDVAQAQGARRGKPPPEPPPTSPPARAWHPFTDNHSPGPNSRLYLLGGAGSNARVLDDFWYYRADLRAWFLAPTGSSKPGPRQHAGLSCGGGQCVTSNGTNGSLLHETWVYTETTGSWLKLNCRKLLCPSARHMVTMAYDPARFNHVLFGGLKQGDGNLDDTYTFADGRWTRHEPSEKPVARRSAAMAYVPEPVDGTLLFAGQVHPHVALCDMWTWNGSDWLSIKTGGDGPCLHSHSMAWTGDRLLIAGGYVDTVDTPNSEVWTFTFDDALSGRWSRVEDHSGCYTSVRPGARMARDRPSGPSVFFGGEENGPNGLIRYDDTLLCD